MLTPVSERMEAYSAKVAEGTDYASPATVAKRALLLRKMRRECRRQVSYLAQTKTILGDEGISVIKLPFYMAFAHELGLVVDKMTAETARIEAMVLIGKWVARDLLQTILVRIRDEVFNLGAPAD